jgi:hypothetical protein
LLIPSTPSGRGTTVWLIEADTPTEADPMVTGPPDIVLTIAASPTQCAAEHDEKVDWSILSSLA